MVCKKLTPLVTYGELAGLPVDAHPHMLRHACGFALADQGADTRVIQAYLGHRCIGSCTWPLRINIVGSPVDRHKGKKA